VSAERFSEHLQFPQGKGLAPAGAFVGAAGGAVCGDLVTLRLRVEGGRVAAAGFDASGCGAATAAGSAAVALTNWAVTKSTQDVGVVNLVAKRNAKLDRQFVRKHGAHGLSCF